MTRSIHDIASQICRNISQDRVYLVGIDGLGGAGKSVLANDIQQELERAGLFVQVIHHDDFYLPTKRRSRPLADVKPIGGDFEWTRLRDEVLVPLTSGHIAKYLCYDWSSDRLAEEHIVQPFGVVLVEGVYCTRAELRDFYDLRIWVDCPEQIRLARGITRDGESMRSVWIDVWKPAEDRYYEEHRPHEAAHIIVNSAATHVCRDTPRQ